MNTKPISYRTTAIPFACIGAALFIAGCSDSDAVFIPVGQFDDGTYEIFGPLQDGKAPLLGVIFAHKATLTLADRTTTIDYPNSYEMWVVDGTYCSSDQTKCAYRALTFKYAGQHDFGAWKTFVNGKGLNNPRYYRATYADHTEGFTGCGGTSCGFFPNTRLTTPVSMFPVNTKLSLEGSGLPVVLVHLNGTSITETWVMNAFFNSANIPDGGATFSQASSAPVTGTPIDCAACNAAIKVAVQYKRCPSGQPLNETETECK